MMLRSGWIRGPWLVALLVAAMAHPETMARGHRGGGRGGRAPRHAAPRRMNVAPRAKAPARPHASNATARNNPGNKNRVAGVSPNAGRTNPGNPKSSAAGHATGSLAVASAIRPTSYLYGSGSNARRYHSYGYGHGYRNRTGGRGYGRSQGNSRALVSRLRSVHSGLARLDHDYRGHRVKAMHSISMAVRQLSHRSTNLANNGQANRGNPIANNRNPGAARNAANGGAPQGARLTQAQSDSRMSQALRTTQGIQLQMTNASANTNTSTHPAARRHVARAVRELHTALAIR